MATSRMRLRILGVLWAASIAVTVDAIARADDAQGESLMTSTSVAPDTTLLDWYVYATFAAFPHAPAQILKLVVQVDDPYVEDRVYLRQFDCDVLHNPANVSHDDTAFVFDFSAVDGGYRQSQNLLRCRWYTHDPSSPPSVRFLKQRAQRPPRSITILRRRRAPWRQLR